MGYPWNPYVQLDYMQSMGGHGKATHLYDRRSDTLVKAFLFRSTRCAHHGLSYVLCPAKEIKHIYHLNNVRIPAQHWSGSSQVHGSLRIAPPRVGEP